MSTFAIYLPQDVNGGAKHEYQNDEHDNESAEYGEHITFDIVLLADAIDLSCVAVVLIDAWADFAIRAPVTDCRIITEMISDA